MPWNAQRVPMKVLAFIIADLHFKSTTLASSNEQHVPLAHRRLFPSFWMSFEPSETPVRRSPSSANNGIGWKAKWRIKKTTLQWETRVGFQWKWTLHSLFVSTDINLTEYDLCQHRIKPHSAAFRLIGSLVHQRHVWNFAEGFFLWSTCCLQCRISLGKIFSSLSTWTCRSSFQLLL